MRFLGVDFGWQHQPNGLACLTWTSKALNLAELARPLHRALVFLVRLGDDLVRVRLAALECVGGGGLVLPQRDDWAVPHRVGCHRTVA